MKNMHIEMDNLAVPEIHIDEAKKTSNDSDKELNNNTTDSANQNKSHTYIDYSGAVPEIHIKH